jgi:hypothetical protein
LKAKTKSKGADLRRSAIKTDGGPSKLAPLTAIEERVLQIVGQVAVEGLPRVQIPFDVSYLSYLYYILNYSRTSRFRVYVIVVEIFLINSFSDTIMNLKLVPYHSLTTIT